MIWNIFEYFEMILNTLKFYQILWNTLRYLRMLWNIFEYFRILWNALKWFEVQETFWNCLKILYNSNFLQVMPLPVFPKNRRKSCISLSATASANITSSAGAKSTTGGNKSPNTPSSPKNSSRRIVVHHQKKTTAKKYICDNNANAWHKLQKLPKFAEEDPKFINSRVDLRPIVSNSVIVKVAHR